MLSVVPLTVGGEAAVLIPDSWHEAEDGMLSVVPLAVGGEAVVQLVGQAGTVPLTALVLNMNGTVLRDFRPIFFPCFLPIWAPHSFAKVFLHTIFKGSVSREKFSNLHSGGLGYRSY